MAGSCNQLQITIFPILRKIISRVRRADDVMTTLHDDGRNMFYFMTVPQKPPFLHKAFMSEIMAFQSCEGMNIARGRARITQRRMHAGKRVFPARPKPCMRDLDLEVAAEQPAVIGSDHVATFGKGYRGTEILPDIGKELGRPAPIKPIQILLPRQKHPAQDHRRYRLGMRLRMGQRQSRPPTAAKAYDFTQIKLGADGFDITDQVGGGIRLDRGMRLRPPAPPLIEQHNAPIARIEKPAHKGAATAARAAMQHHHRPALRIAALLDIEVVTIVPRQHEPVEGLDFGPHPTGADLICCLVHSLDIAGEKLREKGHKMTRQTSIDPSEVAKFEAMAAEWWDPNGKFRPLHMLNPVRLDYVTSRLAAEFDRDLTQPLPLKGIAILDIGCGGGLMAEPLARLGATVTGADAASGNIRVASLHAQQMGLEIEYIETTAEALLDQGRQFDAVLALEIIEHVADPQAFATTCGQLAVSGGAVIVSTLNRTAKSFAMGIIGAEWIMRWLPKGTHDWHRFITPAELEAMLDAAQLKTLDRRGMVFNPLAWSWSLSQKDLGCNYLMAARRPAA